MLDDATAQRVGELTAEMWAEKLREDSFIAMAAGKEIGHRIADFVDDRTTGLLKAHFETRFQAGPNGHQRSRSMADVWLRDNTIYHPINVKTGETDKKGQPNLVSLKKLIRALLCEYIDSYYLLIVKFKFGETPSAHVFLVDLLDCLDHVTYDAGPGQMMLKEKSYYAAVETIRPHTLRLDEKIAKLFVMLEDGDRRLTINRARDLLLLRQEFAVYQTKTAHTINQDGLNLIK